MPEQEPTIEEARQAEVLTLWRCPECSHTVTRGEKCPLHDLKLKPLPVIPLEPLRAELESRIALPGNTWAPVLRSVLAYLDPKDTP